jgi:hypothetical protein
MSKSVHKRLDELEAQLRVRRPTRLHILTYDERRILDELGEFRGDPSVTHLVETWRSRSPDAKPVAQLVAGTSELPETPADPMLNVAAITTPETAPEPEQLPRETPRAERLRRERETRALYHAWLGHAGKDTV